MAQSTNQCTSSQKPMPFHASLSPSLQTHPVKLMHEKQSSGMVLYNFTTRWHNPQINAQLPKNHAFSCLSVSIARDPSCQVTVMHEKQSSGMIHYNFTNRWHNPQINAQVPKNPCLFMPLCLHRSRPILSS